MSRSTVSSWISRGAPVVTRADRATKREWKLSLPDIIDWRIKTAVDDAVAGFVTEAGAISKDEADRRKAVAQARLCEVELDEKIGSVILVADAEDAMADFCLALRSGLSNCAVKSAGRTATMTVPHEIREFFESEINRSMKAAQQILNETWAAKKGDGAPPEDLDDDADEANNF
ncbi:MAG: hypothetical protein WDN29_02760 [Methylovirgula sp.]